MIKCAMNVMDFAVEENSHRFSVLTSRVYSTIVSIVGPWSTLGQGASFINRWSKKGQTDLEVCPIDGEKCMNFFISKC